MIDRAGLLRIDIGRVVAVPVFAALLLLVSIHIHRLATNPMLDRWSQSLLFVHLVLVACFYLLVIYLYLVRTAATSTTASAMAKIIAVASTFSPFLIPLLPGPSKVIPGLVTAANLIMIVGIVFSLCALSTLGRNLSIVPQARRLVQTGPYRLVRHPLYLGEFVITAGVVLASPRLGGSVFCCFTEPVRSIARSRKRSFSLKRSWNTEATWPGRHALCQCS